MARHPRLTARGPLSRRGPARRQRGIALILVLWVVALLVIMAVGVTSDQRTETSLAANQASGAQFRALAEAAINYAVLNLTTAPQLDAPEDPLLESLAWVPDGAPRPWRFAGEELTVTIVNERSLIDLNQATKDMLTALLAALAIPPEEADPLADAVLDWRDTDDLRLLNGAEDPDYESDGLPYGAKDAPFDTVEELQQVKGFDRALFLQLAPALTVWAGTQRVVPEFAPPLVQAAVEGRSLEEVELRREEEELERQSRTTLETQAPRRPADRGGPLYRLRIARGAGAGAPEQAMEVLVELSPGTLPPYRVLWRNLAPLPAPPPLMQPGTL